jgi:hypothetical protein
MQRPWQWNWPKLALLVWTVLVLGLTILACFHPTTHTVYKIYAPAAQKWWAGENIYVRTFDYYRYSPLCAILLTPFVLLPGSWGGALWKAFNCLFYAGALGIWARRLLTLRLSGNQLAGLFLLVIPLSMHSMYNGQANLVMLGACLLALTAAGEERWNRAAGWLALASLIKGYPLALALLLMALYPRRFALRFVAALGIGLLLPFATHWPSVVVWQYGNWWNHLQDSTEIMRERLRTLDHLWAIWQQPLSPAWYSLLGMLAGMAALVLAWFQARQKGTGRELLLGVWLLFSVWVALFGPATESCTYVVMAPGLAWALIDAHDRQAGWPTWLVLIASLFLMGPVVTDLFGPRVRGFATAYGSQPLGGLLFLGYLLSQRRWARSKLSHPRPFTRPNHSSRPRERNEGFAACFTFSISFTRCFLNVACSCLESSVRGE